MQRSPQVQCVIFCLPPVALPVWCPVIILSFMFIAHTVWEEFVSKLNGSTKIYRDSNSCGTLHELRIYLESCIGTPLEVIDNLVDTLVDN